LAIFQTFFGNQKWGFAWINAMTSLEEAGGVAAMRMAQLSRQLKVPLAAGSISVKRGEKIARQIRYELA